jgi:hypothetical protein
LSYEVYQGLMRTTVNFKFIKEKEIKDPH